MKINIDEKLKQIVDSAAKFAASGRLTKIAVYSCIKISVKGGTVTVYASNGHASYTSSLAAAGSLDSGEVTVDAALFSSAVDRFIGGEIKEKDGKLLFRKTKQSFKLDTYKDDTLPDMPKEAYENGIELETVKFIQALKTVGFAMCDSLTANNPTTASVHVSSKDGWLHFDAMDGMRLARYSVVSDVKDIDMMIPDWVVNQALVDSTVQESEKVRLYKTDRHVWLVTDAVQIVAAGLAGQFFDCNQIFDGVKGQPNKATSNSADWAEAIKTVSLVKSQAADKQPLILDLLPKEGKIQYGIRTVSSEVKGEIDGVFSENADDTRIGLNIHFVIDVIRHIKSDKFVLHYAKELKPVYITTDQDTDESTYSFIVMPVRLNSMEAA